MLRNLAITIWTLPRRVLVVLIDIYQATFSPDHGPLKALFPYGYCRHSPTCSMYAKQAILRRGAVIGLLLSFWRILRCNPFAKPDPQRILEVAGRQ